MTENIRNIAVALAVIIVSCAYTYSTFTTSKRTNDYYNHYDKARAECLKEGENAAYNVNGYQVCMHYRGYPEGYDK